MGHHIGDLEDWETLRAFGESAEHLERLFAVTPEVVAHDLHPGYLSTAYALEREGVETLAVQHHHAHLAACLAEWGEHGPAVGAILDGTGYGTDGTIWGGEILVGGPFGGAPRRAPAAGADARRRGRHPRALADGLRLARRGGRGAQPAIPAGIAGRVDPETWNAVARVAGSERSPLTTSAGRLLDAVSAICGLRARVTYEGQAAIELEAACDPADARRLPDGRPRPPRGGPRRGP